MFSKTVFLIRLMLNLHKTKTSLILSNGSTEHAVSICILQSLWVTWLATFSLNDLFPNGRNYSTMKFIFEIGSRCWDTSRLCEAPLNFYLFRTEFRQPGGDHHGQQADDEAAMTPDREEGFFAEVSKPLEILFCSLKLTI